MASNTSEHNGPPLLASPVAPSSAATAPDSSRLEKVFAMTGGVGTDSYAHNSSVQGTLGSDVVIPFYEEVLENLILRPPSGVSPVIRVADLGCSSGENAITQMSHVVRKLTGRNASRNPPEWQAFFCDLPSTDFNTLFQLLTKDRKLDFFISGTPGSFFGRLHPRSSINVFYSTLCLHFLSQIPAAILDKTSPAFHKGEWSLQKDSSSATKRAIQEQAASDFKAFLHARAIELSPGGVLMFAAIVQVWTDSDGSRDFLHVLYKSISQLWRELTAEGIISQETADRFFFPFYDRSMEEIIEGVQHFSSAFSVHRTETANMKSFEILRSLNSAGLSSFLKSFIGGIIEDLIGGELSKVFWDRATQTIEAEFMPHIDEYELKDKKVCLIALTRKDDGGELY